jgi:uncharacterized membrane protein
MRRHLSITATIRFRGHPAVLAVAAVLAAAAVLAVATVLASRRFRGRGGRDGRADGRGARGRSCSGGGGGGWAVVVVVVLW